MVYGLSQVLARGNSCRKISGSWCLVEISVLGRVGSWWLVVGRGGLYVLLDSTLLKPYERILCGKFDKRIEAIALFDINPLPSRVSDLQQLKLEPIIV